MKSITVATTDAYIAGFPIDIQKTLETVRNVIRKAAPQAEEVISYNMPAYKMKKILVWYAACNTHIGFYPTSSPPGFLKMNSLLTKLPKALFNSLWINLCIKTYYQHCKVQDEGRSCKTYH